MTLNADYYDAMVRRQVFLLRHVLFLYDDYFLSSVRERRTRLEELVQRAFRRADSPAQRLRAADRVAREADESFSEEALIGLLLLLARDEVRSQVEMVQMIFPWQQSVRRPSRQVIENIVRRGVFNGRTIAQWLRSVPNSFQTEARRQLRVQVSLNNSVQDIIRTVAGRSSSLLVRMGRDIEGIIRTAAVGVSTAVRSAFAASNPTIFGEEIYSAVLDRSTTPICRSLDGDIYPLGEGPHPPVHFNCRSIRVPIVSRDAYRGQRVSQALVSEFGRGPRNTWTESDRDAFRRFIRRRIGDRPVRQSYSSWLQRQSAMFQDEALGSVRGQLFRRGNLPLDRFVDRRGSEIPLSRLARLEDSAFRAAGLSPSDYID